jgi:asparagine synthase (glutamine-hydrolysing)
VCGILGIVAPSGRSVGVDDAHAERMRDLMVHRGPDDAGIWRVDGCVFAHRRLAVLDTSPAGRQPMRSGDGRFVLVYNGELYNEPALRKELEVHGVRFRSACDTETVLMALATWGDKALRRFRGMFALGLFDTRERRLLLARDPLGVKPLYFAAAGADLVFASEIPPVLAHPAMSPKPNLPMVSAYLTTIRTCLGNNTLFEGVYCLAPGQSLVCDCAGADLAITLDEHWTGEAVGDDIDEAHAAALVREELERSVKLHLRADVPTCALLSGGLDSTVTTMLARPRFRTLRTYAAGAERVRIDPHESPTDDLAWARLASEAIGTRHAEAAITERRFTDLWSTMIERTGVPLSTPNETAIYAVASRLREDGCIVTISGEGADELFAGYELPMSSAWRFAMTPSADPLAGGEFQLESNAWLPTSAKSAVFNEHVWRLLDDDEALIGQYRGEFSRCVEEVGERAGPVDAHLRFLRRVNLTGLLQRLDSATMLASVEGRTPFADKRICAVAEAMPMSVKFDPGRETLGGTGGAAVATQVRTKIALREAFRANLPPGIADRPKASFPLPFQEWLRPQRFAVRQSEVVAELFTPAAIESVARDPGAAWRLAWPMLNIALWARRWWG